MAVLRIFLSLLLLQFMMYQI